MILRNAAMKWGAGVVSMLVGILTTPILVNHLGQEFFGIWLIFMGIASYMNFLDLGLGTALTKHLAHDYSVGDWRSANGFISSGLTLFSLAGLVVAAIYTGLIIWGLPLFDIDPARRDLIRTCLIILGAAGALAFPSRVAESVLAAGENYHVFSLVEMAGGVLRLLLIIAVLGAGGHLLGLTLVHVGVLLAGYLVFLLAALKIGPKQVHWGLGIKKRNTKALFKHGSHLLLYQTGHLSLQQGPTILLGALSSPVVVSIFGVGNRVYSMATAISRTALDVSMARFSALDAKGERDVLRGLFLDFSLYSGLLAFYLGLGIVIFIQPFILLWVGPKFMESITVVWFLLAPMVLFLAVYPCFLLLVGMGRHRVCGLVHIAEAALALSCSFWAVSHWGAAGMAACMGGSMLLLRPWLFPWQACRSLELNLGRYFLYCLARPALASAICWGLTLLLPWLSGWYQSWIGLIISGVIYSLLFCLCAWLLAFKQKHRLYWRDKGRALAGYLPGSGKGRQA